MLISKEVRGQKETREIWVGIEEMRVCTLPRKWHDSNLGGRSKSVWRTEKYSLFDQLMFIEHMLCARHCSRH